MKLPNRFQLSTFNPQRSRQHERGSATILVFALVAILVVYMNGNQLALHSAKRELRLLEANQVKKFQAPPKPAQADPP